MLYLVLTVCSIGALLASTVMHAMWPDWREHHEPLHSTIEAVGGLVAIAMAMVLLHTHDESTAGKYRVLAAGFLGMGILQEFHAIARPGNEFVLFRNLASLAGGIGFLLVWRSHTQAGESERRWHSWAMAAGALSIGTWFLMFPQQIPEMVRNGEFTPTAVAPQSVACILFLLGTARLLLDYRRSGRSQDALFASLALLFGLAELVFMYSVPWDNRWWFWHSLRLIACLLALGYIGRSYFHVTSDLRASLAQTIQAKETLGQSEGQLRQMLGERARMAEDLHDSTIQSLFAVGLNLERCQRLVSTTHHDVGIQLGTAVAALKAVIRDLRGYILGLEFPISNGRALEAALASLVADMNHASQLHFRLRLSPEAADRLTPEQAAQLLPIAREAMSNSLRHSSAHAGTLSLQLHDGFVRLIVEDDGVGFDAATVQRHGHGLKNMERRAKTLSGRLEVVSSAGQGTRIVCDLPQERDDGKI
ncbi:MAG TPA: sensor histidine kinase [Nitrospira sp.]|nr:sensor histidine kinase [Nitrospira sp.]